MNNAPFAPSPATWIEIADSATDSQTRLTRTAPARPDANRPEGWQRQGSTARPVTVGGSSTATAGVSARAGNGGGTPAGMTFPSLVGPEPSCAEILSGVGKPCPWHQDRPAMFRQAPPLKGTQTGIRGGDWPATWPGPTPTEARRQSAARTQPGPDGQTAPVRSGNSMQVMPCPCGKPPRNPAFRLWPALRPRTPAHARTRWQAWRGAGQTRDDRKTQGRMPARSLTGWRWQGRMVSAQRLWTARRTGDGSGHPLGERQGAAPVGTVWQAVEGFNLLEPCAWRLSAACGCSSWGAVRGRWQRQPGISG